MDSALREEIASGYGSDWAQLETVIDRGKAEAIALAVERSLDERRKH
jgi:predicted nucleic acid-binding protein